MKLRRDYCKQQDGFTLVEVLVSFVVLVIGLFGILALLLNAAKITMADELRNRAAELAYNELAVLQSSNYENVVGNSRTVKLKVRNIPDWQFVIKRQIQSGETAKIIEVTVEWEHSGSTHHYTVHGAVHKPTVQEGA